MAELSGNKKFMDYFGDKLDEEYSIEDFKQIFEEKEKLFEMFDKFLEKIETEEIHTFEVQKLREYLNQLSGKKEIKFQLRKKPTSKARRKIRVRGRHRVGIHHEK